MATRTGPTGAGGVEGLVWVLTRDLTRMGHDVTVFATADSEVHGELVMTLPSRYGTAGSPDDWQLCEWVNLSRAVEQSARFDVVHSHAYLWGLPLDSLSGAAMVHTTHVMPWEDAVRLRALFPCATVTAISRYQWSYFPELQPADVIHHGIDLEQFRFRAEPEDYLVYLGRFIPEKGPLQAIRTARDFGARLLLAGPPDEYYRQVIEPLVDGRLVEYVGIVTGQSRDELLSGARALLYPVQSPEPFGLVMVEAMMCGTPVVATRLGAVPEIVDEGVTGYTASTMDEFRDRIDGTLELDRRRVREVAESRFSSEQMARRYLGVYERVVGGQLAAGAQLWEAK